MLLRIAKTVCGPLYPALRKRLKGFHLRDIPVELACGLTLRADLQDATWARLARHGHHEPATDRFLAEFLRPGDVFVDVGAQVGILTAIAAKTVGPQGRVFAFDVDPGNISALRSTIRRNRLQNVIVVPQALGDREADVEFVRPDRSWGAFVDPHVGAANDVRPDLALQTELDKSEKVMRFRAQTTTLDHFAEMHALPSIDLIKIDVDGMEFEVLQGATRVLRTRRPAIIYEDSQYSRDRGGSFERVFAFLDSNNYFVFGCHRDASDVRFISNSAESWVSDLLAEREDINLLCLPREELDCLESRVWFAEDMDIAGYVEQRQSPRSSANNIVQGVQPRVSVIIPTYNRCELLKESLSSVLTQTLGDLEVIVVDDGSTDGTREFIETIDDARVRYLHQENHGPSAARNTGIAAARGELIAFQDSDDLWTPEKLQRQVDLLDSRPDIGWVYCNMSFFDCPAADALPDKFTVVPPSAGRILKNIFTRGHPMSTPTVVVRRACQERVGKFDECLTVAEDIDMWLRLAAVCNVDYVNEALAACRRESFPNARQNTAAHLAANCRVRSRLLDRHPALWSQCSGRERYHGYSRFVLGLALNHLQAGRPIDARRALREFGGRLPWLMSGSYLAGSWLPRLFAPLAKRYESRARRQFAFKELPTSD